MKTPILEMKHIRKTFASTVALGDVDLNVYPGEIRGLIGENGSGKSTISSIAAGMQKADSGEMLYHGKTWTPGSMIEALSGGIGMIVNEYTGVDDVDSMPSVNYYRVARDHNLAAAEALVDAVHMYDCRIVAQLHHAGSTSNPAYTGRDNIAPSAVPIADGKPVPREMTLEDIKRVQGKFIDAAVRCKKVGYDAVELHGAHGYLLTQFFNRYYNRRTDEYGGSVENRCRFIAEIIAGIREKLGPKYPILVRMCGDEMTPIEGFFDLEEGIEIAKYLESLGIDAIDISMGSSRKASVTL